MVTQDDARGADAGTRYAQDGMRELALVRVLLKQLLLHIQLTSLVYRYRHCFS